MLISFYPDFNCFDIGYNGIGFIFLPQELISYAGYSVDYLNTLIIQILGALYFAGAVLNWMAKANLIGGIYSKPVALRNFSHFFIAGITLLKAAVVNNSVWLLWITAFIYSVFAVLFATVAFGNPVKSRKTK